MAKRFVDFAALLRGMNSKNGYYKPTGTMGKHHCTVVSQGDALVVVGSVEGRVTVHNGDTLGYDCGSVWLVPNPESYKDPVRRILAVAKISQKVLQYSNEPVRFTVSCRRCLRESSADTGSGDELFSVLGEYTKKEVSGSRWDGEAEPGWMNAFSFGEEVVGGQAIVIRRVVSYQQTTHCQYRRVSRVVVRPDADKVAVATWLEELITPEGQERRRQRELTEKAAQEAKDVVDLAKAKRL